MNAVVILQARMASTRLPGKALATLAGASILSRCIRRLQMAAPVMVATTTHPDDDRVEREAMRHGALVFRGPDRDVLRRFVLAAESARARFVVRATADNPAVDMEAAERLLGPMIAGALDYVSESGMPYGGAVEAVSLEALNRASGLTGDPDDREHVTMFIRRNRALFRTRELNAPDPVRRPDVRVTIDTADDLESMRAVYGRLGAGAGAFEPRLTAVIRAADEIAAAARREVLA